MLRTITRRAEISDAHTRMADALRASGCPRSARFTAGYQGGKEQVKGFYSPSHHIWWAHRRLGNRYWDAVGMGPPLEGGFSNSILFEMNSPLEGINRRDQGVFAEDAAGRIFLLHRGRLGGGKVGIGKDLFHREFAGKWRDVIDGKIHSRMALIGEVTPHNFATSVAAFAREVLRLKRASSGSSAPKAPITRRFLPEGEGEYHYDLPARSVHGTRFHGSVVRQLAELLREEVGWHPWNTKANDLLAMSADGSAVALFEVKTSSDWYSVYAAVGQLTIHGIDLSEPPALIAVLPTPVPRQVRSVLRRVGISLLKYHRTGRDSVAFADDFAELVVQSRSLRQERTEKPS